MSIWWPYPKTNPWHIGHVVHLHRRAAFGATWSEIERDLREGCEASAARLLNPKSTELHARTEELAEAAVHRDSVSLLQAAWINEMWSGSDPVGEQLTLMWHNHFATGHQKVRDCRAMYEQYLALRKHARAPFSEMVAAIVRDRAMLIWLDGNLNRKGHANENLARELMELFTLGEGEYSEGDVREAARALTGWIVRKGKVAFDSERHDFGAKQILGETGDFGAGDLVQLLMRQPAVAKRMAWRICDHFLGRKRAPAGAVDSLAEQLWKSKLDVRSATATVLRSSLFFDDKQRGSRLTSPNSFVVSNMRALELHTGAHAAAPGVAAYWMRALGQDLFQPPGVGGWPGGTAWMGVSALVDRARFAVKLGNGPLHAGAPRVDLAAMARRHKQPEETFAGRLLLGDSQPMRVGLPQLLCSTRAQFD